MMKHSSFLLSFLLFSCVSNRKKTIEYSSFNFKKDYPHVEKILKESPQFLISSKEDGGLDHTKKYFELPFMKTLVAKEDNKVVGFVNYTREPKKFCLFFNSYQKYKNLAFCDRYKALHYLHIIAVNKNHGRKGIASSLLERVQKELKGKPVLIDIHKENLKSQFFFRKKKFKEIKLEDYGLEDDSDPTDLYLIS